MCNLYSMTSNQDAIRNLFGVVIDNTGNMPSQPGVYPDYSAPIVRNSAAGRELIMARWGMPTPPSFLVGKKSDGGVTNIRNPGSPHWRRWLNVESRCLVPWNSFAEPDNGTYGGKAPVWFAFDHTRPLACFAGLWTRWTSVRKVKEGETTNDIFGFLTTEPNAEVGAIHPKAMPVILRTKEEYDTWMSAPVAEALKLQRALPDGALRIVAHGVKQDGGASAAVPASQI
ncbi:MAG: SOS response-associated peptidase [Acetobacteraceae bacterium]